MFIGGKVILLLGACPKSRVTTGIGFFFDMDKKNVFYAIFFCYANNIEIFHLARELNFYESQ